MIAALTLGACSSSAGNNASSSTTTAGPHTPVSVPAWNPPVVASDEVANASTPQIVAYGPDPAQTMEVFQSSGDPMGTIIYIHGGGWSGGSAQDNTNAAILSQEEQVRASELAQLNELAGGASKQTLERVKKQLARGWDIVSIDYRLATGTEAPGVAAALIIGDVDRAIRYAIANAYSLQLGMAKLVLSGASAGGHLTLMEALTANAGTDTYIDPTLPADLRAVTVRFDGIVPFVAPTDIATFAQAGGLAPAAEEALLGCTTLPTVALPGSPLCPDMNLAESLSPITLTRAAAADGSPTGSGHWYDCEFTAIPASVQFRSRFSARVPQVLGLQPAFVYAPDGQSPQTPYTDSLGRIQLLFPWSRNGKQTAWVRKTQVMAGDGWGHMHCPRQGDEVLVAFEHGNVDRPVIVGCLFNGNTKPPLPLPDAAHIHVFKDQGGNLFTLNPQEDGQTVTLSSPVAKSALTLGASTKNPS
jgi:acetyl esterase/lipase